MITKQKYFKWLNGHRKNQVFLAIISAYIPKRMAQFVCRMNVTKGVTIINGKIMMNGNEITINVRSNDYYSTLAQLKVIDFENAGVKPFLFRRTAAKTFHIGFKSLTNNPIVVAKSENDTANVIALLGISVGTYNITPASEQKIYVSDQPYSSNSDDSPANQQFNPIIKSIPYQRRSISVFDSGSKNDVGELILKNENGELDSWSYLYFKGRQIIICLGDPSWPLTDMLTYPIFVGAVKNEPDELNPEVGENEVSFRFGDIWQELNIPIQEQFITSGGNVDKPIPIILGKCQNLAPVLLNSATQTHIIGGSIAPSKVYEGGNDVSYNWTFSNGQITPNSSQWKPFYTVTCDINNPSNTPLDLVQYLVSKNTSFYNKYLGSFGDLANKSYELGIYIDSPTTVINVLDKVLDSVWGWRLIDNENKFQFGLFIDPRTATPEFYFDESTIEGGVEVSQFGSVYKNVKLRGVKNNTVLKLNDIPEVLKRAQQPGESTGDYNTRMARLDFVQMELKTLRSNGGLDSEYPVQDGEPIETLIQSEPNLQAEADYRQLLSSTPISAIKFTGKAFFEVLPGKVINVQYKRHGLLSGINVFVTSTERQDWARRILIQGLFYGEY